MAGRAPVAPLPRVPWCTRAAVLGARWCTRAWGTRAGYMPGYHRSSTCRSRTRGTLLTSSSACRPRTRSIGMASSRLRLDSAILYKFTSYLGLVSWREGLTALRPLLTKYDRGRARGEAEIILDLYEDEPEARPSTGPGLGLLASTSTVLVWSRPGLDQYCI